MLCPCPSISGRYILNSEKSLVWYVFSLLSLSTFVYVGTFGIFWLDAIVAALIGFFMIGIVPICFNFGGELVYPESEATGSALLTCSANLIGQNHLLFHSAQRSRASNLGTLYTFAIKGIAVVKFCGQLSVAVR